MDELQTDTLPKKADKQELEQYITWEQMDDAFKEHKISPPGTPIPPDHPSPEVVEALRVVGELADEYENLKERLRNMEEDLDTKITADEVSKLVSNNISTIMLLGIKINEATSGKDICSHFRCYCSDLIL